MLHPTEAFQHCELGNPSKTSMNDLTSLAVQGGACLRVVGDRHKYQGAIMSGKMDGFLPFSYHIPLLEGGAGSVVKALRKVCVTVGRRKKRGHERRWQYR